MRRSGLAALLALGASALAIAGCGGGGGGTRSSHSRLTPETASGRSNEAEGSARLAVSQQRPCRLVSRARASAIVGARLLKPIEAPQGPTCIYRAAKGRRMFSLAVQSIAFETLRRQLPQPARTSVSGRPAYCVTVGQPTLYVRLAGARVLSVQAACPVGKRFALAALARMGG